MGSIIDGPGWITERIKTLEAAIAAGEHDEVDQALMQAELDHLRSELQTAKRRRRWWWVLGGRRP